MQQAKIFTLCSPNPFSLPKGKGTCISILLKEIEGRPFVGTWDSFHNLKYGHFGIVPASSYLLPNPNKLLFYSLSDVGFKAKDQKFTHQCCTSFGPG
jgi:hypothetical protein